MTDFARVAALAAIALVVALTLGPVGIRELSPVNPLWDRSLAYAVIGFLLILAFPRRPVLVVIAMLAMIFTLEAAQHLFPGRHGRVLDAVEKSVGAGVGAAAAIVTLWLIRRRRPG